MHWLLPTLLAALLVVGSALGAKAADLVVWWKAWSPQEEAAVRETIAAFETDGKQVELVFYPQAELSGKIKAALEAGQPPDFAFGTLVSLYIGEWAFDDRLLDLTDTVGHFSDMFDPDLLAFGGCPTRKPATGGGYTRCR
jgi:ABC-type glycerol-3-phosphate transport system substrate-binding protein